MSKLNINLGGPKLNGTKQQRMADFQIADVQQEI